MVEHNNEISSDSGGADYRRPEQALDHLNACLDADPGDGSLVRAALNDIARARGMSQVARDAGMGRESLYKALGTQGNPEFLTVLRVIRALGFKLHVGTV